MDHGSSDRVPASVLILLASVVFTLLTFFIFKFLWAIPIPGYFLVGVLGLQFASLLLGSSKILTQLGAASLSALIALAAGIGTVFFFFPPVLEARIAGIAGNVVAMVFIMASFVAASREDPLPSAAPMPLIFDDLDNGHEQELVKYGEIEAPDTDYGNELPLTDKHWEEEGEENPHSVNEIPSAFEPQKENDPSGEFVGPGDWVEETARVMAYDTLERLSGDGHSSHTVDEKDSGERPAAAGGMPGINMRTHYKVIDSSSGEHYGTYYGDEGYSTLDLVSLTGLIGSRLAAGELRIIKLDWSNFDEIEVHVQVEEVLPVDPGNDIEEKAGRSDLSNGQGEGDIEVPSEDQVSGELQGGELSTTTSHPGIRYAIYDRRTIQPMGEYVPDGDRSRIDRLTLYKMFPEYDFKSFEIDSIRWEADEVRIFIKGERKDSPRTRPRRQKEKNGQRDMLEETDI